MSKLERLKQLYPFEIEHMEKATIQEIEKKYLALLTQGKKEGFTPLFIAFDDVMEENIRRELEDADTKSIMELAQRYIEKASTLRAKDVFHDQYEEFAQEEDSNYPEMIREAFDEDFAVTEEKKTRLELITLFDYNNKQMREDIFLMKLPTNKPYRALAYIPMGGFNDCPLPEEQVAVCKYWYEQYGAIPAAITYDTLEFYVEKPVHTLEDAKALAVEQFLFCTDLGTQVLNNIEEIADFIYNNPQWYFWWD